MNFRPHGSMQNDGRARRIVQALRGDAGPSAGTDDGSGPQPAGSPSQITLILSRWIDRVADAIVAGLEHMRRPPLVTLAEQEDGSFTLEAPRQAGGRDSSLRLGTDADEASGSDGLRAVVADARVEVLLRPDRFLFRSLELPSRAGEFLEGIIRAQIDRLTPWSTTNVVFGWSPPAETGSGRMVVTIAATGRNLVDPIVEFLSGLGAASIHLTVLSSEAGGTPITVAELKTRAAREIQGTRRILVGVLAGLGGLAAVSLLASTLVGSDLDSRQADMARRIDEIRASFHARHDPASEPVRALQQRKQDAPSSVVVLEALSRALPDHTYLTEMRMQDGKVQMIGMTSDAPSLIRRLEQDPHFSEASFFAPTTKSVAKPGDNFHIEARIRPPRAANP